MAFLTLLQFFQSLMDQDICLISYHSGLVFALFACPYHKSKPIEYPERTIRISTSNEAFDRNKPTNADQTRLQLSLIEWKDCVVLHRLPARLVYYGDSERYCAATAC
jgi:hypothetical protein